MATGEFKTAAEDFVSFVNASPTPFHAVKAVKEDLVTAGFREIKVSEISIRDSLADKSTGERVLVNYLRAWWKVLSHSKWLHSHCICNWQEMETGQPNRHDWCTYRFPMPKGQAHEQETNRWLPPDWC